MTVSTRPTVDRPGEDKQRSTWLIAFVSARRTYLALHSQLTSRPWLIIVTARSGTIVLFNRVIYFHLGWNDGEETCAGGLSRLFPISHTQPLYCPVTTAAAETRFASLEWILFGQIQLDMCYFVIVNTGNLFHIWLIPTDAISSYDSRWSVLAN